MGEISFQMPPPSAALRAAHRAYASQQRQSKTAASAAPLALPQQFSATGPPLGKIQVENEVIFDPQGGEHYSLFAKLGQGAFGTVYSAYAGNMSKAEVVAAWERNEYPQFALKELRPQAKENTETRRQRAAVELNLALLIEKLTSIRGNNLCEAQAVCAQRVFLSSTNTVFIVFEWEYAMTLKEFTRSVLWPLFDATGAGAGAAQSRWRFVELVARMAAQLCASIAALNDIKVFHHDIKPDNLFVVRPRPGVVGGPVQTFQLKISDFGNACSLLTPTETAQLRAAGGDATRMARLEESVRCHPNRQGRYTYDAPPIYRDPIAGNGAGTTHFSYQFNLKQAYSFFPKFETFSCAQCINTMIDRAPYHETFYAPATIRNTPMTRAIPGISGVLAEMTGDMQARRALRDYATTFQNVEQAAVRQTNFPLPTGFTTARDLREQPPSAARDDDDDDGTRTSSSYYDSDDSRTSGAQVTERSRSRRGVADARDGGKSAESTTPARLRVGDPWWHDTPSAALARAVNEAVEAAQRMASFAEMSLAVTRVHAALANYNAARTSGADAYESPLPLPQLNGALMAFEAYVANSRRLTPQQSQALRNEVAQMFAEFGQQQQPAQVNFEKQYVE